jgi:predicted DNA-binding transcriptional regulator AlpA
MPRKKEEPQTAERSALLVRSQVVRQRTGLNPRLLLAEIKGDPSFPQPVKLGKGKNSPWLWPIAAIEQALLARTNSTQK